MEQNLDQKINTNTEEMSENRQRFIESANKRTNNILKSLRVLGNCANHHLYQYSPQDIEKIFKAIEKTTIETKARFMFSDEEEEFKL